MRGLLGVTGVALLAGMFAWTAPLAARTYFLATNGSDANRGTSLSAPLKTFAAAVRLMEPGDICLVRGGVYHQTLQFRKSGEPGRPIEFAPYHRERVIIDGADPVTGWRERRGGIYYAPMAWSLGEGLNQVFVKGRMILEARYPAPRGENPFHTRSLEMAVPGKALAGDAIVVHRHLFKPVNFWKGSIVLANVGYGWNWQCAHVIGSTPGRLRPGRLRVDHTSRPWFGGIGRGYLIGFGLPALTGDPSSWVWEAGKLYLRWEYGKNPASLGVQAKRRAWCVDFRGHSWITVRGFQFFAGAVRMAGDHDVLTDCRARYLSQFTYFRYGNHPGDGANSGLDGVYLKGDHNVISYCELAWSAGSGVVLDGQVNLITRNVIRDCDYAGLYDASLVISHGGHDRILFNTMFNAGRDIIEISHPDADRIEYNDLYRPGLLCRDLGVIYTDQTNGRGTRIEYNWIHDNPAPVPANAGVYLDDYSRDFVVDHNVIWGMPGRGGAGVLINNPLLPPHRIFNNTLFFCRPVGADLADPNGPPRGSKILYKHFNNLWLGNHPGRVLRNFRRNDFQLKPGAPPADRGKGAYPLAGRDWTAGVDGRRGAPRSGR